MSQGFDVVVDLGNPLLPDNVAAAALRHKVHVVHSAYLTKDEKNLRALYQVIDHRDFETGFTAMNQTVGYTASIGAKMIGTGKIIKRGLQSPVTDIPYETFVRELDKRGIHVTLKLEPVA